MITYFERFVALRYLWRAQGRKEGKRFVRFITFMAIGGVAIGVTALLLALAIVRGFSNEIKGKIISFGAHIQLESFEDAPLQPVSGFIADLDSFANVTDVNAVVEEFALLRSKAEEIDGVSFRGVNRPPPALEDKLISGNFAFEDNENNNPGIVIGSQLARLLSLEVGDEVAAYSMRQRAGSTSFFGVRPKVKEFYIAGIYETSFANFDELFVYTDIAVARALFGYTSEQASRLDLLLTDADDAAPTARAIEEAMGYPIYARTVFQVFRQYFAWVNLQESIIPLIIGSITLVGAFNIIGTLLMILLEKTHEVGVLSSMGASPKMLRRLFLLLGLLIGAVGMIAGQVLALVLAVLQKKYAIIPLPEEAYYMKVAPIELHALDFLIVGAIALALCLVAAYIPARAASRIEPIRAIRFR